MRGSSKGGRHVGLLLPLLLSLGGVFLLQNLLAVWLDRSAALVDNFALSLEAVRAGKVWVLVTYSFLHGGFWHLLGNALIIFFAFNALRESLSDRFLLGVYALSVLSGGLLCLFTQYLGLRAFVMGASAGALGLLSLYCLLHPNRKVVFLLFFVLPVCVKPKWIFCFLVLAESFGLLFEEIPVALGKTPLYGYSNIAYAGHVGGILVGVMSFLILRWGHLFHRHVTSSLRRPYRVQTQQETKHGDSSYRLDAILEKINARGLSSLTEKERDFIEKTSR